MGDEGAAQARYSVVEQLDRLGIWNRRDRLYKVSDLLGKTPPVTSFHELTRDEALAVAARLAEEATPDVDAGV